MLGTFTNYDAQRAIDLGEIDEVIREVGEHKGHFIDAHPQAILDLLKSLRWYKKHHKQQ